MGLLSGNESYSARKRLAYHSPSQGILAIFLH